MATIQTDIGNLLYDGIMSAIEPDLVSTISEEQREARYSNESGKQREARLSRYEAALDRCMNFFNLIRQGQVESRREQIRKLRRTRREKESTERTAEQSSADDLLTNES